jgi:ectoine hydroxylase-related dioxygenase (phytanoyl-CoA dioxygenase family)
MTSSPSLQEEVNFFLKWGYLIVDNALTGEQLSEVTSAFKECFENKDREFTHSLIEEDERFDCLLENPPIIQRMKAILGNCLQLHSATARVTRPGAPDQPWHRDGSWPVSPEGTPYGSLPGQINCAYYLDELTSENGPLVILPAANEFHLVHQRAMSSSAIKSLFSPSLARPLSSTDGCSIAAAPTCRLPTGASA